MKDKLLKEIKSDRKFANFGEYFYWAYANLQMLVSTINNNAPKYNCTSYMIRAKAFKAYKEGRWKIRDLYRNNRWKLQEEGRICWYCGKEVGARAELTADHVIPRAKGGDSSLDNLVMVCRSCNSSKGKMDLLEWYFEKRNEFPMPYIFAHYYKQIYLYAVEHGLLDKTLEEIDLMELPFNYKYIVQKFPAPEYFYDFSEGVFHNGEKPDWI